MGFMSSVSKAIMGSPSKGKSSSVTNPDQVWSAQAPYLTDLYGAGKNLAASQMAPGSQFNQQNAALNNAWQQQLAGPTNPYLTGMASNAMAQISKQFNEQIMPSLLGGGNNAGQLGQERYQNLQNSAVDTAAMAMANAGQNVYGQAWNSGLAAQSNAIGQGGAVMAAPWAPLAAQSSIVGNPTVLGQGGTSSQSQTGSSKGLLELLGGGSGITSLMKPGA